MLGSFLTKSQLNASHEKERSVQTQPNVSRQKERPVQSQLNVSRQKKRSVQVQPNVSQKHATVTRIFQIMMSLFSTVLSVPTIKNIAVWFYPCCLSFDTTFTPDPACLARNTGEGDKCAQKYAKPYHY